ncbi:MAG: M24 family metallopeptidase [Pseudonocardiaceae bacterium]|nr:M24 family metallopeptidase [Pseudonocardiaceae bacterium]
MCAASHCQRPCGNDSPAPSSSRTGSPFLMTITDTRQSAFPAAEYSERVERLRVRASAKGFDVLVVTDPKNIFYLTGYDAYSYYVPQSMVVPVASDAPVLVLRRQDVPAALWTTHLDEDQILGYGDEYLTGNLHPMEYVAEVLKSLGFGKATIGIEFDGSSFSPRGMHVLEQALADATFADMNRLVEWVRCVKSEREIQVMHEAGRISDHAMETAFDAISLGIAESQVAARTYAALVGGLHGIYGSAPWQPYMSSGQRTNTPHLRWSDEPYRMGRPTMIELGGHRHNYAAGLSRTIFLGRPPADYRSLEGAVVEGLHAALPRLRAGNRAEDVERVWRRTIESRGFEKNYRIGYSIGISFPDTGWVERTISLAPGDRTVLNPGMTIHLMLAVWLDRIGYSLSETFVVGDGQPERLSSLPWELMVK